MEELIDSGFDAPGFSVRTGHYLAWASNFAYEDTDAWAKRLGLDGAVTLFTCGQFHGFVGKFPRGAVVALRGTQSVENCFTDAETALVRRSPYPGRVHHGFADGVDEVWPEVKRLLGNPAHAGPIWVTGHSLGGAMATLASVRLNYEGYRVRAVYTYGSPRPGDAKFRRNYRLPNYRFVNHNDLVPHLPFLWCFKHVGELKLIDLEEGLLEDEGDWDDRKVSLAAKAKQIQRTCLRSQLIEELCELQQEMEWLDDHLLDRYLAAIEKLLPHVPRRRLTSAFSKVRDMMPDLRESDSTLVAQLEGPRSLPADPSGEDVPSALSSPEAKVPGEEIRPARVSAGAAPRPMQPPTEFEASLDGWWASAVARAREAGQEVGELSQPSCPPPPQPPADEPKELPSHLAASLMEADVADDRASPEVASRVRRETSCLSDRGARTGRAGSPSGNGVFSSEGKPFLDVPTQPGGASHRRPALPPWGDQPSVKQCLEDGPTGLVEPSNEPEPVILPMSKGTPQPVRPRTDALGGKSSVSAREMFFCDAVPASKIASTADGASTASQEGSPAECAPAVKPARSESEVVAAFFQAVSQEKTSDPIRRQA